MAEPYWQTNVWLFANYQAYVSLAVGVVDLPLKRREL